jgi:hypothetical protein
MNHRRYPPGSIRVLLLAFGLAARLAGGMAEPAPAPAPADPPDLETLLQSAVEHARRDREMEARFRERYAYVRTKLTETLNADGEVKKREYLRREHTPERPEPDPWAEAEPDAARSRRAYERRDVPMSTNLLARFRFTLAGREDIAGRPAWVVDFAPAAERLPAANLIEKFINRMAGRVWIDVAEQYVRRGEFRLTEPVNVVGGLVGALRQCEVFFERTRTADGLWYTHLLTWRIEGRQLWSRRIMAHRETLTEVRPAPGAVSTAAQATPADVGAAAGSTVGPGVEAPADFGRNQSASRSPE